MNVRRLPTSSLQVRLLALAVVLVAAAVARPQQAPLFPSAVYETGEQPEDIIAGDVTGDGHLDLVTADYLGGTLSLLVGHGAGDFAVAVPLAAGARPAGPVAADVSGDGVSDLVCGDSWSPTLTLYVADGAGGFAGPTTLPVPFAADTVLAGDMDGDGGTDLVSVAFASATVVVEAGDGGGGFTHTGTGWVGAGPRDAALADLDDDGNLDVVTADQNGSTLSILTGNGSGGFTTYLPLPVGASLKSVAVADLDADGHLDVAAGTDILPGLLLVWPGVGGGAFGSPVPHQLGGSAFSLAIVNFDADETLDVVAADEKGKAVRWLIGDGVGGFEPVKVMPVTHAPWAMAVRDLDADGDFDLGLAANEFDHATVVLAESPASFPANVPMDLGGTSLDLVWSVVAGDVNGDGAADVMSIRSSPATMQLLSGTGDGGLGPPQPVASASYPSALHLTDMDGDGNRDLVYLSSNIVDEFTSVQLGDGAGGFAGPVSTVVPGAVDLTTGDVNGDGDADAVLVQDDFSAPGQIHVLVGDGAGGLGAPFTVQVATVADLKDVLLADVTGDERQDALVLGDHKVFILAGDGLGGFSPAGQPGVSQGGAQAWTLAAGDFDADGDIDLAAPDNERLDVLINAGAGAFLPKVSLPAQLGAKQIAQRDLDGDGLQDLVTANDTSGSVTVFVGNGAGGFVAQHFLVGGEPSRLAVADMDGDGAPDLVLGHDGPPSVEIIPNLAGAPAWTDLGHALAGTLGVPTLTGTGELVEGTPGSIALANAAPLAPAALFVSLLSQPQPFKGGLLVPLPPVLILPLPTGADGTALLAFTWPSGIPTGTEFYVQMAIQDGGAPAGVALSNALRGVAD